jgi:GNAT superfamily N-acetyltransferase
VTTTAELISEADLRAWRERYRNETKGQIVHDSLHGRAGWTVSHLLSVGGVAAGYGSSAIAGPWACQPTVFEFFVLQGHRYQAFALFEKFLAASGARHFEVQTNDVLLTAMLHAYGRDIVSDRIVFEDEHPTNLPANGARFVHSSSEASDLACIARRQGGSEWRLELGGAILATGGVLFHYNPPFGDIHMEVAENARRQGWGSYMVQELKRSTYSLGQIPCARCVPSNVASRLTLQKAGFAPCGHILTGRLGEHAHFD